MVSTVKLIRNPWRVDRDRASVFPGSGRPPPNLSISSIQVALQKGADLEVLKEGTKRLIAKCQCSRNDAPCGRKGFIISFYCKCDGEPRQTDV